MTTSIDFAPYLESIGVRINRVTADEINAWCPAHIDRTGQQDRKPSFYFNQEKQVGHCWSCDWKVPSLAMLVQYVTGRPPDQDVVTEAQGYSLFEAVRQLSQAKKSAVDDRKILEWQFEQLAPVPDKLLGLRRLNRAIVDFFQIRFDTDARCWALPIHSPQGQLLGWQQRQKGAVNNYPAGIQKAMTLFGLHRFDTSRLVLVESPLDAVRLYQIGVPAVASFGAEVSNKQVELLARNCSEVVVALDNDSAGQKATDRVLSQLRKRTGATPWRYSGRIKDIGDYGTDEALTQDWRRTRQYGWE